MMKMKLANWHVRTTVFDRGQWCMARANLNHMPTSAWWCSICCTWCIWILILSNQNQPKQKQRGLLLHNCIVSVWSPARSARQMRGHFASLETQSIHRFIQHAHVHTQPTQNNNNSPCALVRAKIHFSCFPAIGYHGHVRVYARLWHINRTMQEPELPSDLPGMAHVARL